MRRELYETRGSARLRWLLGMAWVAAIGLAPALVASGVVFGVLGGAFGTNEIFFEVYRSGSHSWIGALAFTVPTAVAGLLASGLLLARHRAALPAAYAF